MVSSCREDFRPSSREDFVGRIDELVDGPNAPHITPEALDRCEASLEDIFNGRLFHLLDAALSDTVSRFHVDIQVRMRMNLWKFLYNNFDELYLYCYYVASTVGLMSVPDMGIAPESKATTESVYNAALALGIATQLTNILRDIGENCAFFVVLGVYATAVDFDRGCRVMNSFVHSLPMLLGPFKNVVRFSAIACSYETYKAKLLGPCAARAMNHLVPQDELAQAGLSDEDIFAGRVTDEWRIFMKKQIQRKEILL
ncbi:hypothetical protein H5410_060882 [Solanum commersonii]|uniref:15-cis-phytoene synthase n=1 Tax=Solanum commersonii TaxID=4109 RepID=A0A9J5W7B9_SOLCO|nr:hypothetical protein H5410_060882 [Solanum commersonii]